jgi:hypothetical protein
MTPWPTLALRNAAIAPAGPRGTELERVCFNSVLGKAFKKGGFLFRSVEHHLTLTRGSAKYMFFDKAEFFASCRAAQRTRTAGRPLY